MKPTVVPLILAGVLWLISIFIFSELAIHPLAKAFVGPLLITTGLALKTNLQSKTSATPHS